MQKTRFPRWRKTFDFPFPKQLIDLEEKIAKIVVYDSEKFLHNKFMGEVSHMSIMTLMPHPLGRDWPLWTGGGATL